MLKLNEFSVLCGFEAPDKESAIKNLIQFLAKEKHLEEVDEITQRVLFREEQGPTAIGLNCAVPHAKSNNVPEIIGLFAISQNGIEWGLEERAHIICLILSPFEARSGEYLRTLSTIVLKLKISEFRQAMLEAQNNDQLTEILETFAKN